MQIPKRREAITADRIRVVTCFVTEAEKVLLLRRSQKVGTYRGRWAAVSGFIESETPVRRAWIELQEELGLTSADIVLEKEGHPLEVDDWGAGRFYLVHPFRFALKANAIFRLDWEHTEFRWVEPIRIEKLPCVPRLAEAWRAVEPSQER